MADFVKHAYIGTPMWKSKQVINANKQQRELDVDWSIGFAYMTKQQKDDAARYLWWQKAKMDVLNGKFDDMWIPVNKGNDKYNGMGYGA